MPSLSSCIWRVSGIRVTVSFSRWSTAICIWQTCEKSKVTIKKSKKLHLCVKGVGCKVKVALKSVSVGLCHSKNEVIAFKNLYLVQGVKLSWSYIKSQNQHSRKILKSEIKNKSKVESKDLHPQKNKNIVICWKPLLKLPLLTAITLVSHSHLSPSL